MVQKKFGFVEKACQGVMTVSVVVCFSAKVMNQGESSAFLKSLTLLLALGSIFMILSRN